MVLACSLAKQMRSERSFMVLAFRKVRLELQEAPSSRCYFICCWVPNTLHRSTCDGWLFNERPLAVVASENQHILQLSRSKLMKLQYNLIGKETEEDKTHCVKSWQQSLPTSSIVMPQSFLFSVPWISYRPSCYWFVSISIKKTFNLDKRPQFWIQTTKACMCGWVWLCMIQPWFKAENFLKMKYSHKEPRSCLNTMSNKVKL